MVNRFVVSVILARNGPNKIKCDLIRTPIPALVRRSARSEGIAHEPADSDMKSPVNESISVDAPIAATAP